jgi:hypothetical protein
LSRPSSAESSPPGQVGSDGSLDGLENEESDDDEEFLYPGAAEPHPGVEETATAIVPFTAPVPMAHSSPAQLEALYAAASKGDLALLKRLFRSALETGDVEAFALANDASSRTGFTALHAAASRGYIHIVKWCELFVSVPCFYILIGFQ